MAKTSRPVNPSAPLAAGSDDPLESATLWLQANGKLVGIGVAVVAVIGLGIYGVRASDAKKQANASTALYAAQGALYQGQADSARVALQGVIDRYGSTSAGEQAVLLLAQSHFDAGEFAEGIAILEEARSGASASFSASMDVLLAAGYEGQANFEKAAEYYDSAAKAAGSSAERDAHRLAQARSLMRAGKDAEAKVLFEELRSKPGSPYAQEAAVRLGELMASGR